MRIKRIRLRDVGPFDDVTIAFPKGTNPNLADVYLLTGPNGSGKSTVLYALAAVIDGNKKLGLDLLTHRMRSSEAMVAFKTDDKHTFAVKHIAGVPGDGARRPPALMDPSVVRRS